MHGYVSLVRAGKYEEALRLILKRLPLPATLGRVCPAPCEKACRRGEKDQPIAIRELKRFVADSVDPFKLPRPEIREKGRRVAVIGSGPAGLTVAYYLRLRGWGITIFEAMEKPGGMLRAGIPDYRLPPDILDKEISYIISHGIELETGTRFGEDISIEGLMEQGFEAVFLGVGAHSALRLNIEGEDDAEGLFDALAFLRMANMEEAPCPGKNVAVIGGGNVAIDAARTAVRLGAERVTVVYRRSEPEMPAYAGEIAGAREEGVDFLHLTAPVGILKEGGRVCGLRCIRTRLGEPDSSGRRRPVPVEGSEFTLDCDTVIPAIGQKMDPRLAADLPGLSFTARGNIMVDPYTRMTSIKGVFAAGDAVTGPATVVEAVAGGHLAVEAIDAYLSGIDMPAVGQDVEEGPRKYRPVDPGMPSAPRAVPRMLPAGERKRSFAEVEGGLGSDDAKNEARRCLDCGGCCDCRLCVEACQAGAIEHEMTDERVKLDVGSIILATGFDPLDPAPMKEYGYGLYANVFTNLEFERLSNATGPTAGRILKRDEKNRFLFTGPPKSVAILHCIGSRDKNYHEYCSRTCCMYALKYAHLIKDKCGHQTLVYNFYIDMRCFGKGYEEFYRRVQAEGVRMVRGKAAGVARKDGMLIVRAEDTISSAMIELPVEMVVLCTAMEPRPDAVETARVFGISTGADGFFQEEHPKLEPVSTPSSGVFLAGACQGPKDIPDTVAQAKGAAAEALALSSAGEVEVSPVISFIDPDICIGCRICADLCAYSAIEFNEFSNISEVNEAVCKGCGSCAAYCPSGAAKVKHFTDSQVFAEIDGLLA